jgi:hypothetical protein
MVSMLKTVFGRFLPGYDAPAVSLRARMVSETERFLDDHRQQPEAAWPRRMPRASDAIVVDRSNPFRRVSGGNVPAGSSAGRRRGPAGS